MDETDVVPVLSDKDRFYIDVVFVCTLSPLMNFIGVIANSINIYTFYSMGAKDSVTVAIIFLSFSDVLVSAFGIPTAIGQIGYHIDPDATFQYFALYMVFVWTRYMMVGNSYLLTVFIALERCLCVLRPLQFKAYFTRQRALIICTTLVFCNVSLFVPILISSGFEQRYDTITNSTRIMLWLADDRLWMEEVSNFANMILQPIEFVAISLCSFIMAARLKTSHKFRKQASATGTESKSGLTGKDRKVVQMIYVVTVLAILAAFPSLVYVFIRRIFPEFDGVGKKFENLFYSSWNFCSLCTDVSATGNILIYYKYSRKFRLTLRSLFGKEEKESDKDDGND